MILSAQGLLFKLSQTLAHTHAKTQANDSVAIKYARKIEKIYIQYKYTERDQQYYIYATHTVSNLQL